MASTTSLRKKSRGRAVPPKPTVTAWPTVLVGAAGNTDLARLLGATLLDLMDGKFCLLRQKLPSRKRLFDDMKALTTSLCFDSWEHLLDFMLEGWSHTQEGRGIRPGKSEFG